MYLSIFEIFKVGVGPSSSHTLGPMLAGQDFISKLRSSGKPVSRITVTLHGSLAYTGRGHATDRAVMIGLSGIGPHSYDRLEADRILDRLKHERTLDIEEFGKVAFDPESDLVFDFEVTLPGHTNGLRFVAHADDGTEILSEEYYSIGGGFIETLSGPVTGPMTLASVPHPFRTMEELLAHTRYESCSIATIICRNERSLKNAGDVQGRLMNLWKVMESSIDSGLATDGILPGGLNVRRRSRDLHRKLMQERHSNAVAPHNINNWISLYAMAVNEENASGGRIVTSPTNGASGVIPATIRYYLEFVPGASVEMVPEFLLTAGAVGAIIKANASISGAECGCQAEVGSASAMAAAGMCEILGGTSDQVENAAEIALEHHLGMTCDPVEGLVQIPCIERNAMGAIKAISAASLSLHGDGSHMVSLDSCIETMRQTGLDMHRNYKETSLGGLAVNIANC